jgi:ABC-type uncharacterized transport system substrate-binding protein
MRLRDPWAKAATASAPIVFSTGAHPVETGLMASLNRPGGNVTGAVTMNSGLGAKRLGLMHELLPAATRFALLVNPDTRGLAETVIADVKAAASNTRRPVEVLAASTGRSLDMAFANCCNSELTDFWSAPTHFSPAGGPRLLLWLCCGRFGLEQAADL